MYSPCLRDQATECCFHGCCPAKFLGLPQPQSATSINTVSASRFEFEIAMISSLYPNSKFTNHESLPNLQESFSSFTKSFPQYSLTDETDQIRQQQYYHLSVFNQVCLDYVGHGLFSYDQQQGHYQASLVASTSTSPPPMHSTAFDFDVSYKSVSLDSQLQYGGPESGLENKIKKRIMDFMNISQDDYTMVFTANQSSAFKLVAEAYPFQSHRNILTVYDYENEAVKMMIATCKKKGARVMSAEFLWPTLTIQSGKLQKKIESKRKRKKRGLFVFPLQSRITGARYSYLWMRLAEENGWHVLLDASALGPKDMETLGLSLFKPDFLICSFFKIFGENPSGFGCLFVKKSSVSFLKDSTMATSVGIVKLVPAIRPSEQAEESSMTDTEACEIGEIPEKIQKAKEIEECEPESENPEMEFRGLDHADKLGLILISARGRYLVNWLINALMSLEHPDSENGHPLIKIYGPKIKFDRGPAVAFNVFDWKGEKIDPAIVQKLADRNNISLSYGFLHHIWIPDEGERGEILETKTSRGGNYKCESGVSVVTAALGLLTNFEDVYRLWSFVSRFLDADFVEKERWRYTALNQNIIEV